MRTQGNSLRSWPAAAGRRRWLCPLYSTHSSPRIRSQVSSAVPLSRPLAGHFVVDNGDSETGFGVGEAAGAAKDGLAGVRQDCRCSRLPRTLQRTDAGPASTLDLCNLSVNELDAPGGPS